MAWRGCASWWTSSRSRDWQTYGMREQDIPVVAAAAKQASSMQGNPIVLTDDELAEALLDA